MYGVAYLHSLESVGKCSSCDWFFKSRNDTIVMVISCKTNKPKQLYVWPCVRVNQPLKKSVTHGIGMQIRFIAISIYLPLISAYTFFNFAKVPFSRWLLTIYRRQLAHFISKHKDRKIHGMEMVCVNIIMERLRPDVIFLI